MIDALAAVTFAVFVVLALATLPRPVRRLPGRGTRVHAFIGYTLATSLLVGGVQWDLWPFVSWPLVAGNAPRVIEHPRLMAVDAAGTEHDIDARAWEPLSVDELTSWLSHRFNGLQPDRQQQAFLFLLRHVEHARMRAASGERIGRHDRWLGPATAPLFLLHPRRWSAGRAPAAPFVGLRLYMETWDVEERDRDPAAVTRRLLHAYPASPP